MDNVRLAFRTLSKKAGSSFPMLADFRLAGETALASAPLGLGCVNYIWIYFLYLLGREFG